MNKPLVLITNDDGVLSPGLIAAAEAVEPFADLLIAAPREQQTSMGRAYPKGEQIGVIEEFDLKINGRIKKGYGIHGTPAQAVSHGILELAPRKPDLCISGINYGENVGLNLIPSGTVGGALEADTYDIPAIAVSQEVNLELHHATDYNPMNWNIAIYFTRLFAEKVLKEGLPYEVAILNINIPSTATTDTPIRLTSQSRQNYFVFKKPGERDFSQGYKLKVELKIDEETLEETSDIQAVVYDKVVSVTPIVWNLTAQTDWGQEYKQT